MAQKKIKMDVPSTMTSLVENWVEVFDEINKDEEDNISEYQFQMKLEKGYKKVKPKDLIKVYNDDGFIISEAIMIAETSMGRQIITAEPVEFHLG